ncbi:MAG: cell division protein ZapA [Candidatus Dadabacteria bacterium]|nr:cell division protein ZapA [Candidatus Dadabacteria bacterium]
MKDRIKVVFLGREYFVLTDAKKDYLMKIVNYLEQKIDKATEDNSQVAISTPVFLASLEIIDDFFTLQRDFDEFKRTTERKTKELVGLLESPGSVEKNVITEERPQDPFTPRGNGF